MDHYYEEGDEDEAYDDYYEKEDNEYEVYVNTRSDPIPLMSYSKIVGQGIANPKRSTT